MSEKDQSFPLIHTPHGQIRPNEESNTKFSFTNFSKEFDDHIDNVDQGLRDDFRLTGTFNQKAERCGRMVTPHLYKHLSRSIYEKVILPSR